MFRFTIRELLLLTLIVNNQEGYVKRFPPDIDLGALLTAICEPASW